MTAAPATPSGVARGFGRAQKAGEHCGLTDVVALGRGQQSHPRTPGIADERNQVGQRGRWFGSGEFGTVSLLELLEPRRVVSVPGAQLRRRGDVL